MKDQVFFESFHLPYLLGSRERALLSSCVTHFGFYAISHRKSQLRSKMRMLMSYLRKWPISMPNSTVQHITLRPDYFLPFCAALRGSDLQRFIV